MQLLAPYREDPEAWDWKFIMFLGYVARIPTLEMFIAWLFLAMAVVVGLVLTYLVYLIGGYLWGLYRAHTRHRTRVASLLQITVVACLCVAAVSISLYQGHKIDWDLNSIILQWVFVVFACMVMGVDWYVTRQNTPATARAGSPFDVSSYLPWKKKQQATQP